MLYTKVLQPGAQKATPSPIGRCLVPCCGFTENVRVPLFSGFYLLLMASWFIAGSGKTSLRYVAPSRVLSVIELISTTTSSAVIREIKDTLSDFSKAHIAYFYFEARVTEKEKEGSLESFRALLSSLLFQLSGQSDQFSGVLRELHSKHRNDAEKPLSSLVQCLKDMLSLTGQPSIYLVLDALDECPDSGMPPSRDRVLDLVEDLVQLRLPNLRICVTSRPEYGIRSALEPLATQQISLHDEPGQKKDIEDYVSSVIHSMNKWTDEDRDMVIKRLKEKADGM
jgi:hypothetical protein